MARKKTTDDLGAGEVQEAFDEAEAKGYVGKKVDPTPNENYTVAGVTSGAPTPETDADANEAARKKFREGRFGTPKAEE
jgi:hypothetical protein